ncbi:hypothetical protein M1446_00275 [Candidatus Dependentiae bacterium]|nr:hypothetical protein [Candidatus Dependentiae bacterium]
MKKLLLSLLLIAGFIQPAHAGIMDTLNQKAEIVNGCIDKLLPKTLGYWAMALGGCAVAGKSTLCLYDSYKKLEKHTKTNRQNSEPKKLVKIDTRPYSENCLKSGIGIGAGLTASILGIYLIVKNS